MAGPTAIGLDIGTSGVRAAEVSFGKKGVTLEKFGQVALPPGAVRDGEVVDQSAVTEALKDLWSYTKFSGKRVILGVANQKVIVRQIDLPWMPADELRKSLPFQVADMIPIPVTEALLDFHPLEEWQSDSGARMLRGLLVAASREMVNNAVSAVQAAGLKPIMVDLTSFAVLRSLGRTDDLGMGEQTQAIVDIGARVTNIIVHRGGVPQFVRILLMGGQDITNAVGERLGVPEQEAEAIKQQLGLRPLDDGDSVERADRIIDSYVSTFVDEVRGSLDYYAATTGSVPIEGLVLSGGGARLEGLAARLEGATRIPVQQGEPVQNMRIGQTGLSEEQLAFVSPLAAVPVGLALGAMS